MDADRMTVDASAGGVTSEGVLVVDDASEIQTILCNEIRGWGWSAQGCSALEPALARLQIGGVGLVLLDLVMPGVSGVDGVRELRRRFPDVDVVVFTGHASLEAAIDAIRLGAVDFVEKPGRPGQLEQIVRRTMKRRRLLAGGSTPPPSEEPELIAVSAPMRGVIDRADAVAGTDIPVLIVGETGTGKELVARRIHARGSRRGRPPVIVNCAAIPEPLLERELFGHVRGAFTGAERTSAGLMLEAHGSTLILDEVGDLGESAQAKVLRACEQGEARAVGAVRTDRLDVRFVACTNRDLRVQDPRHPFRPDLYHRLAGVVLEIPPLRSRLEDVPQLALHFLAQHRDVNPRVKGLEPEALEVLFSSSWPGNARHLRNVVREAMLFARGERLGREDLSRVAGGGSRGLGLFHYYQRLSVVTALEQADGDVEAAADGAGVSRATFYRLVKRYGAPVVVKAAWRRRK
jgi:DNA-binding NtrC family response regulator